MAYVLHDLYSYDGVLKDCEGITYKIAYCKEVKKWLYSFRDARMAAKEEHDYLERATKKPEFNNKKFKKKQKEFGTVVLECDEKMTAEIAYRTYAERWNIELVCVSTSQRVNLMRQENMMITLCLAVNSATSWRRS